MKRKSIVKQQIFLPCLTTCIILIIFGIPTYTWFAYSQVTTLKETMEKNCNLLAHSLLGKDVWEINNHQINIIAKTYLLNDSVEGIIIRGNGRILLEMGDIIHSESVNYNVVYTDENIARLKVFLQNLKQIPIPDTELIKLGMAIHSLKRKTVRNTCRQILSMDNVSGIELEQLGEIYFKNIKDIEKAFHITKNFCSRPCSIAANVRQT